MEADTCRLCLRPIDKAKSTDLATESTKLAMLKEFLPEVKLDIAQNTQICYSCLQDLEVSYNFKQGVLVNEATIQAKLEENDLKNIDLRIMLDDFAKKEVKPDDFICRTCFSICETPSISLFDAPSNMMPCSFVKKMCQLVFELEFITSDKPVLCDDCWNTLQTVYNFRKCCIKTDKKLLAYIAKMNLTKVTIAEFKTFAKEDLPNDNDEYSSDDELGTHVKEELVDEDELKFNPDEASCSSGSFKVKEETAVKCESDLNSEDENIKDEPEYLDLKAVKSEASELEGEDCKMEIGEVKVDAEGDNSAGPSGFGCTTFGHHFQCDGLETPLNDNVAPIINQKSFLGQSSRDVVQMLSCAQCSYKTRRNGDLKRHLLTHQPEDMRLMFSCARCVYKTLQKGHLIRHMLIHQPECMRQLLSCAQCSYKTKRSGNLKHHMLTHQPEYKGQLFSCTECIYKCRQKKNIKHHMLIHQPGPLFSCTKCSYKSREKQNLKMHMLIHEPDDIEQMISCTQCSYRTRRKCDLKRHQLIHEPDHVGHMFSCAHCSYQTKRNGDLKRHLLTHQPVVLTELA